jgi:uncharacterized protein YjdB
MINAGSQYFYLESTGKGRADGPISGDITWEITQVEAIAALSSRAATTTDGIKITPAMAGTSAILLRIIDANGGISLQDVNDSTVVYTSNAKALNYTINKAECTIAKGFGYQLTVSKESTWASSDEKIATVNNFGYVTTIAEGSATITATSTADTTKTISCAVTVIPMPTITFADGTAVTKFLGSGTYTNVATGTGVGTITYESSDTSVATVDATSGAVTIIARGTTYITATAKMTTTSGDSTSGVYTLTVYPQSSAALKGTSWVFYDQSKTYSLTFDDENTCTRKTDSTVDESGQYYYFESSLSGVIAGKTFTVSSDLKELILTIDGSNSITYVPYYALPVSGITLSTTNYEITTNGSYSLSATVLPANATNKEITWASSNPAVVTVDANGVLTVVATGSADITVTANDGSNIKATCAVTVIALPELPSGYAYLPAEANGNWYQYVSGMEIGKWFSIQNSKGDGEWLMYSTSTNKVWKVNPKIDTGMKWNGSGFTNPNVTLRRK